MEAKESEEKKKIGITEKCARMYLYVRILCVYYGKDGSEYHVAT